MVSKSTNIVHIAIGHDGIHAVLVNEDGTVYFVGTARRGEDGDTLKNRRQPKAVKPKKIQKLETEIIVHASCNNGTSAFVTTTGKLIMFGKDTAHCDATGHVTELLEQHITKVSLGKAHCVALNNRGQIFSFGLNNKGQCGHLKSKGVVSNWATNNLGIDMKNAKSASKTDIDSMCDIDDHNIIHGQCRVCAICRESTRYKLAAIQNSSNAATNDELYVLLNCKIHAYNFNEVLCFTGITVTAVVQNAEHVQCAFQLRNRTMRQLRIRGRTLSVYYCGTKQK